MSSKKTAVLQKNIGILFIILSLIWSIMAAMASYSTYDILSINTLHTPQGNVSFGPYLIEIIFHILGFILTMFYLVLTLKNNLQGSGRFLCSVTGYFFLWFLFDIFSLSEEEKIRGLTIGLWIYRIVTAFAKYALVLLLLSNGYFGLLGLKEINDYASKNEEK